MSHIRTFELYIAPANLDAFYAELVTLLAPVSREEIRGPGASTTDVLAQRLRALASARSDDLNLCLTFPEDPELLAFHCEDPDLESGQPGRVAVAEFCFTCQSSGDKYEASFTSYLSSISYLMVFSTSVHDTFRSLARYTTDGKVWVQSEWDDTPSPLADDE